MTATACLFTERQFLHETRSEIGLVNNLVSNGIIKPAICLTNRQIFFKSHLQLVQNIKALMDRGFNLNQILPNIENGSLDIETVTARLSVSQTQTVRRRRRVASRNVRQETPVADVPVTPVTEVAEFGIFEVRNEEVRRLLSECSFTDLADMANGVIPNFRRMSKVELAIALGGDPEQKEALISMVRERTKNRYGSGSQNTTTAEVTTPELEIPQPNNEVVAENNSNSVEDNEILPTDEMQVYNREDIEHLNIRQLADLAKFINLKYFRRMKKSELIIALSDLERRAELQQIAFERQESYKNQ